MRQRIWQVVSVVAVLGLFVASSGAPAARAQGQTPDVERPDHDEIAQMTAALKREVASDTLNVQRLQAGEAAMMQDLATGQGRWSEINQRLEELDRALTGK